MRCNHWWVVSDVDAELVAAANAGPLADPYDLVAKLDAARPALAAAAADAVYVDNPLAVDAALVDAVAQECKRVSAEIVAAATAACGPESTAITNEPRLVAALEAAGVALPALVCEPIQEPDETDDDFDARCAELAKTSVVVPARRVVEP